MASNEEKVGHGTSFSCSHWDLGAHPDRHPGDLVWGASRNPFSSCGPSDTMGAQAMMQLELFVPPQLLWRGKRETRGVVCYLSAYEAFHTDGPLHLQIFHNIHAKPQRPAWKRISLYVVQSRRYRPRDVLPLHAVIRGTVCISFPTEVFPAFPRKDTENESSNFSAETCTRESPPCRTVSLGVLSFRETQWSKTNRCSFYHVFLLTVEADTRKASKAAIGKESVRGRTRKMPPRMKFV